MDKEQRLAQFQSKTKANIMRKKREDAEKGARVPTAADKKRMQVREN